MIRVLEFSNSWSMGGTEKTAQMFVEHLPRDKYEVYAAGWGSGQRLAAIEKSAADTFISKNPIEMARWIASKSIDIVHFHRGGWTDSKLINTFVEAGVPILVEHNIFGHFDRSPDREKIDKHILLSRVQLQLHGQRGGPAFERHKCIPIYMPVDTREWDRYARLRDTRKPIFGRHSRPAARKWHDINVDCLPYIKDALPDAEFHVIGLPKEFKEKIEAVDCMDMVREFPTTLSTRKLSDFLYGINVFSHGSLLGESFGLAIAEAMATGLPIVTHTGGDRTQAELVTEGINGYVTPPDDPRLYAARIVELLQDQVKLGAFSARSRARARQALDIRVIIAQLDTVFSGLYAEKND